MRCVEPGHEFTRVVEAIESTLRGQPLDLGTGCHQPTRLGFQLFHLRGCQFLHSVARGLPIALFEQFRCLVQRKLESSRVPNEGQSPHAVVGVKSVARRCPRGRRHDPNTLVVADGLNGCVRGVAQLADRQP